MSADLPSPPPPDSQSDFTHPTPPDSLLSPARTRPHVAELLHAGRSWLQRHDTAVRVVLGLLGVALLAAAIAGATTDRLFAIPVGFAALATVPLLIYAPSAARRRVDSVGALLLLVFMAAGGATCFATTSGAGPSLDRGLAAAGVRNSLQGLAWYEQVWPALVVSAGSAILCVIIAALLWAGWYAPWRYDVEGDTRGGVPDRD